MGQVCETTEPEAIRQQFPFYNEIESIFTARMQRMLWSEPRTSSKRKHNQFSSDEEEAEELNQDINEELLSFVETHKKDVEVVATTSTSTNPKKRAKKGKGITGSSTIKAETAGSTLKEMLEDFMRQTVKMEKEWRDAWEMKAREKEQREIEWRRRMVELEEERAAAERSWMEREDQRRLREETRAQKRDTLIDVLLNKLNRDRHYDQQQGF